MIPVSIPLRRRASGFTLIELLVALGILGIVAAIAIPLYMDYVRRAQVAEALALASSFKPDVGDFVEENRRLPKTKDISRRISGNYVKSVKWRHKLGLAEKKDGYGGSVVATMGGQADRALTKGVKNLVLLTPWLKGESVIEWECSSTVPEKYLPASCGAVSKQWLKKLRAQEKADKHAASLAMAKMGDDPACKNATHCEGEYLRDATGDKACEVIEKRYGQKVAVRADPQACDEAMHEMVRRECAHRYKEDDGCHTALVTVASGVFDTKLREVLNDYSIDRRERPLQAGVLGLRVAMATTGLDPMELESIIKGGYDCSTNCGDALDQAIALEHAYRGLTGSAGGGFDNPNYRGPSEPGCEPDCAQRDVGWMPDEFTPWYGHAAENFPGMMDVIAAAENEQSIEYDGKGGPLRANGIEAVLSALEGGWGPSAPEGSDPRLNEVLGNVREGLCPLGCDQHSAMMLEPIFNADPTELLNGDGRVPADSAAETLADYCPKCSGADWIDDVAVALREGRLRVNDLAEIAERAEQETIGRRWELMDSGDVAMEQASSQGYSRGDGAGWGLNPQEPNEAAKSKYDWMGGGDAGADDFWMYAPANVGCSSRCDSPEVFERETTTTQVLTQVQQIEWLDMLTGQGMPEEQAALFIAEASYETETIVTEPPFTSRATSPTATADNYDEILEKTRDWPADRRPLYAVLERLPEDRKVIELNRSLTEAWIKSHAGDYQTSMSGQGGRSGGINGKCVPGSSCKFRMEGGPNKDGRWVNDGRVSTWSVNRDTGTWDYIIGGGNKWNRTATKFPGPGNYSGDQMGWVSLYASNRDPMLVGGSSARSAAFVSDEDRARFLDNAQNNPYLGR